MSVLFRDSPDFINVTRTTIDERTGRAVGKNIVRIRKADLMIFPIEGDVTDDENVAVAEYILALGRKTLIYNENCFLHLDEYVRCALEHYESIDNSEERLVAQTMLGDLAARIRRTVQ